MSNGLCAATAFAALPTLGPSGRRATPDYDVVILDGRVIVAVWNIVNPGSTGAPKPVKLDFKGIDPETRVSIQRLDDDHGNALGLYQKMGSPRYPTKQQIDDLREQSILPEPEFEDLTDGGLTLELPVNALVLVQVR